MIDPFVPSEHADILRGFAQSIEVGWLVPIPHGYCFSCEHETIVYDVLIGPAQPPRCGSCFITSMIAHAADPEPDVEAVSTALGLLDLPADDDET
jgi:hypothetical protein